MIKPQRIYIASKYTASTEGQRLDNVHRAMEAAYHIVKLGHVPFIPHLTHYLEEYLLKSGRSLDYEDYMRIDASWLRTCDALLYLTSSPGADRELEEARERGLIIYYSLNQIPRVGDDTSNTFRTV